MYRQQGFPTKDDNDQVVFRQNFECHSTQTNRNQVLTIGR
jgi:hypothetical protein